MIREAINRLKKACAVPTAEQITRYELEEARLGLLAAQADLEYAASVCSHYEGEIERLTNNLSKLNKVLS